MCCVLKRKHAHIIYLGVVLLILRKYTMKTTVIYLDISFRLISGRIFENYSCLTSLLVLVLENVSEWGAYLMLYSRCEFENILCILHTEGKDKFKNSAR